MGSGVTNMHYMTYQIPRFMRVSTKLPIKDKQGKTIYWIQKQPHPFPTNFFHAILRGGLPFTYKIRNENGNMQFSTDCTFPGFNNTVTDHLKKLTIPVTRHRVHAVEKAYSFEINTHEYYFERDFLSTYHLKCDNKEIASLSMPFEGTFSKVDTIKIISETQDMAALISVLFYTFYYYNA